MTEEIPPPSSEDVVVEDHPTTDGKMTLDELRMFFVRRDAERDIVDEKKAQADQDWRDRHDREANDRHFAIANLFEADRQNIRREIAELWSQIAWLRLGLPKPARLVAYALAVCAIVANAFLGALVYLDYQRTALDYVRLQLLRESPVIRAEKLYAPGK